MDQNTGKCGRLMWSLALILIGKDLARNNLIVGSLGMAKLREKRSTAEKAKADRKSRTNDLEG